MSFFRSIWRSSSRHKKLTSSDEVSAVFGEDTVEGVSSFNVKYLGCTAVEAAADEAATADAVKAILSFTRGKGLKSLRTPKVSVIVSTQGINVLDLSSGSTLLDVSIYRISYCSADALHGQVFAFIVTNKDGTMECHAFLCPKRKMAQNMSMTVARIFTSAFQLWQMSQMTVQKSVSSNDDSKGALIDFESTPQMNSSNWVCFDDEYKENYELDQISRFPAWNKAAC